MNSECPRRSIYDMQNWELFPSSPSTVTVAAEYFTEHCRSDKGLVEIYGDPFVDCITECISMDLISGCLDAPLEQIKYYSLVLMRRPNVIKILGAHVILGGIKANSSRAY